MSTAALVDEIAIVDNHAHPIVPVDEETTLETFASYFTEGPPAAAARHTLAYRAALSLLADRFDECGETRLFEARQAVPDDELTRELLAGTGLDAVIVDEAFPTGVNLDAFAAMLPADVHPVLRIESTLEALLEAHDSFDAVVEGFETRVDAALAGPYVGLKSIAAYRSGLAIESPSPAAARDAFERVTASWTGRLEDPVLLSHALELAADRAAAAGAPIQFHTGLGDADAHPAEVDPSRLFPYLKRHPDTPVVLLHAGYPNVRTAGYITSVLPNVHLDLGLAIPFVHHGCRAVIRAALELAPTTKLMYSSDGCFVPERYRLGLDRIRADLPAVLDALIADGFIEADYAGTVARNVLRENAVRLYGL